MIATPPPDLAAIRAATPAVQRRQAATRDARRPRPRLGPRLGLETLSLERSAARLPEGPILDLGCDGGDPVARWWSDRGRPVPGLGASPKMPARARLPAGRWALGAMRHLDRAERFAGALASDAGFHPTPAEHRALLPRLARHLVPGGAVLLTVGPADIEGHGHVGGEAVRHGSPDPRNFGAVACTASASAASRSRWRIPRPTSVPSSPPASTPDLPPPVTPPRPGAATLPRR